MASLTVSTQPNTTALESLPVEIQAHILSSLQNVKTLRSLLRASPRFLEVYQQTRENTLSNIVYNQITPAVLPLAINVLQQSYLRSYRRPRSKVLAFLETFKQSPSTVSQNHFSLEISKKLLKTHALVEQFIDAFVTDRLNRLSKYVPQITPLLAEREALVGSSGIEHHRLARALYHLELYGILFYDPKFADDVMTVEEQSSLFLAKLPDWEFEEFLCVREYLLDGLSKYLDQVEDDFFQDYNNDGPPADITDDKFDMRFEHDYEYWYFFSDDGKAAAIQYRWMEGCLTRGLTTLQNIFQSHTPDERELALGALDIDRPRNTMRQTIDALLSLRHQTGVLPCNIQDNTTNGNSMESANDAWLWALKKWRYFRKAGDAPEGISNSQFSREYDALRRWGYAMWSNETLSSLGLLEKAQPADRSEWAYQRSIVIYRYRADDLTNIFTRDERRPRVTVETRTRPIYNAWREEALKASASKSALNDG